MSGQVSQHHAGFVKAAQSCVWAPVHYDVIPLDRLNRPVFVSLSSPPTTFSRRSNTAEDKFVFCNGLVLHDFSAFVDLGSGSTPLKTFP